MSHPGPIDFHCHLDDPAYDGTRAEIIQQCFARGFAALVTVADPYSERSLALTAELASSHDGIAWTVGAHPHQADHYGAGAEKRLLAFLSAHRPIAIGEVGLDFHYDLSAREVQVTVFRRQIAIAREQGLPLVIHSRKAESLVLQILKEEGFPHRVVFHCYTGDGAAAAEIVGRGYFLSFSGIITFKKADALRDVVAQTPLDRLFCETDSPYLSPEPERGRINTPLAVVRVAERIAAIKSVETADLLARIAANYRGLRA